jgi:hypothetical protein
LNAMPLIAEERRDATRVAAAENRAVVVLVEGRASA